MTMHIKRYDLASHYMYTRRLDNSTEMNFYGGPGFSAIARNAQGVAKSHSRGLIANGVFLT